MPVTCPVFGFDNPEGMKFCGECGARLVHSSAGRANPAPRTVLFADVTGSTALGEQLDPEALRALMDRYFARMRLDRSRRHGGTVEKFIGDAVMAVFGIPQLHEDDALRAVRAAADIREALAALNEELERGARRSASGFRTGVNTGEVVAGDPATGTTLVTGDTVNTAARLEQAAPPGEILLGEAHVSLVRDAVDVGARRAASPPRARPSPSRRTASSRVRAGAEGRARHLDAPLVGRERELAASTRPSAAPSTDRTCQLFTLLGAAGVGKSRLAAEFLASVAGEATRPPRPLPQLRRGHHLLAVAEIVRGAAGITEAATPRPPRRRSRALLGDAQEADGSRRLGSAIGLSAAQPPQDERLLGRAPAARARWPRRGPLVVVIEDIHWAEPALLDLIEHVADWTRDAPLLLLCPARPELLDARPRGRPARQRDHAPARAARCRRHRRLIEDLPGGAALPPVRRRARRATAEGNPLFVEELLAMLVDEGCSARVPMGPGRRRVDVDDVRVPPSISALLAARLQLLGARSA